MKRFYANMIAFLIVLTAVLGCLDIMSMREPFNYKLARWTNSVDYFGGGPDEISPYIERAQTADGTTKLIIGDSVCHQLFSGLQEYNGDISILGSNGAITMAGQYILAKEYLEVHPSATDVFLIVLPESFGRTFDTKWGYQYTVMPFVGSGTIKDLDSDTIDIMARTYGRLFMNERVVRSLYLSAVNRKIYLNVLADRTSGYKLSDRFELADRYVVKIADLCASRGVRFHLYPCPVCETKKEKVENLRPAFEASKVYALNPDLLDMVLYYPAEQASDGTHFSGDYKNREHYNRIIRQQYEGLELLDGLKLE